LITIALLACAEGTEILGGLGDNITIEVHMDGTRLLFDSTGWSPRAIKLGPGPRNLKVGSDRHGCS
jgi:hypothetical protein